MTCDALHDRRGIFSAGVIVPEQGKKTKERMGFDSLPLCFFELACT